MPGAFLPGEAGHPLPLAAPGDLPAEACAEDPEIPPPAAGLSGEYMALDHVGIKQNTQIIDLRIHL